MRYVLELLALLLTIIGGGLYSAKSGEAKGKQETENDQRGKLLDDIKQAKDIDDASSNDNYAKRVQDQFTRK